MQYTEKLRQNKILTIGIDGGDFYPFGTVNSGIKRIVDSFLRNIPRIKGYKIVINYYYFGSEKNNLPKKLPYTLNICKLPNRLFSSLFLPYNLLKNKNDVYIGFSSVTPHFLGYFPIKKIIFLYDLGFLAFPDLYKSHEKMVDHTLRTIILSDRLVVLSNCAKKAIKMGIQKIDSKKIIVKYPGNDHFKFKPKTKSVLKDPYFLYVGVVKPIKDVIRLIKLFRIFKEDDNNIKLVIIGRKENRYWKKIQKTIEYQEIKNELIFLENIIDKELLAYYQHSIALLNVSKVEGLGFPVLEALSLGKTVIVNKLDIYEEFDNKYPNLWVGKDDQKIIKLMNKVVRKPQLIEKEPVLFTWKEFSEKLLDTAIFLDSKKITK
ncbi:MAG TPA: glycosyltransferase family 1 protein [Candidatus Nitrosocosmicus sp.]|nr:glycosyltransferase family 1 protein [Candidatus Nitrosocosmicus sp.]